ncbi:hypothetical protein [Polyangium aurulentum]|uniref:hypothetical protein n=1 Tax=Polyangium aurulentum TaxID=2567896 RepID=UPI0010AE974F|nr:hypothetical protein [Polyangium aurulentum]UQA56935.1 hypothetical protein E8A73_037430 [Polyangium aurulentum]
MKTACARAALALALLGCERGDEIHSDEGWYLPSRVAFPKVLDALEPRCATLDCHGKPARNLRLYTSTGLRLLPSDVPGSGSTTEAEYEASYQSVVGLEPEVTSLVVGENGEAPERLTFVRKGRGAEAHKGGVVLIPGDSADACLTSWLASALDEDACARAAEVIPPW